MRVNIGDKIQKDFVTRIGDVFLDRDHNGLYLAAKVDEKFALVGLEGDYWGTWNTVEEFKKDVRTEVIGGRFVQYSQNEYEFELKRK